MVLSSLLCAVVLAHVLGASAHDYLVEPQSRSMTEQTDPQQRPCRRGPDPGQYKYTVVVAGEKMKTMWRGVHVPDSNVVRFALVPTEQEPVAIFERYVIAETNYDQVTYDLLIPEGVKSGRYTLQWSWAQSYSCTDVWVIDRSAGSFLGKNGAIGQSVGPDGEAESRSSIDDNGGFYALGIIVLSLLCIVGTCFLVYKKTNVFEPLRERLERYQ